MNQKNKSCETCSYYYENGFCTYHLTYWNKEHHCPKWTEEESKLDYEFLYELCKRYLKICKMYNRHEKMLKSHPDEMKFKSTDNYDFFLQCCLNDMKRELGKWRLKK